MLKVSSSSWISSRGRTASFTLWRGQLLEKISLTSSQRRVFWRSSWLETSSDKLLRQSLLVTEEELSTETSRMKTLWSIWRLASSSSLILALARLSKKTPLLISMVSQQITVYLQFFCMVENSTDLSLSISDSLSSRNSSLCTSWVDPMFSLPRKSPHCVVTWHSAIWHGSGWYSLWKGWADLQCWSELPTGPECWVSRPDPTVPATEASGPTWLIANSQPHMGDRSWRHWGGRALRRHIRHRKWAAGAWRAQPQVLGQLKRQPVGLVATCPQGEKYCHATTNTAIRKYGNLNTCNGNLKQTVKTKPLFQKLWQTMKAFVFCNVPYSCKLSSM